MHRLGRELRGEIRFGKSRLAQEVYEDVKGGTLRAMSIGYQIEDLTDPDHRGIRTAKRWKQFEASVVAVPADTGAQIGERMWCNIEPPILGEFDAGDKFIGWDARAKQQATVDESERQR